MCSQSRCIHLLFRKQHAHHDNTFSSCSHFQTVIKLVLVESLWCWLLYRKLVLHTMSYRKAHLEPPRPRADRQDLRAPPPTPPELDPRAREPDDNTIDELPDHPMLMRWLSRRCGLLGLPSKPVPSPKWDLVPMLPARIRRIVYMYCWGPPNEVACACYLTSKRGRQDWVFRSAHANKSILGIRPHRPHRIDRAPDVDGDGDNDSTEPFVGTDDGFEAGKFEACYVNSMHLRKPHKAVRRIVNITILRVEPRP